MGAVEVGAVEMGVVEIGAIGRRIQNILEFAFDKQIYLFCLWYTHRRSLGLMSGFDNTRRSP